MNFAGVNNSYWSYYLAILSTREASIGESSGSASQDANCHQSIGKQASDLISNQDPSLVQDRMSFILWILIDDDDTIKS